MRRHEPPRPSELTTADAAGTALPGEERVREAAERSLVGERHGLRAVWPFLGPAFIAAVAYVDPGNFATNIAAGSKYGYLLLWVILASNLMAMLVQALSAKLGIATGMSLPEVCRRQFPRRVVIPLWLQAELIAMATDVAEFLGAAIALNLLFEIPLFAAALLTGGIAFLILGVQTRRGFRHLEALIAVLVGVILLGFGYLVVEAEPAWGRAFQGMFRPGFEGADSLLLAVGILGATVMPHVIYVHSALTQSRIVGKTDGERRRIFRFERVDVLIAMSIAGLINMSMLVMAAGIFHSRGLTELSDLDEVFDGLHAIVGGGAAVLFGIALLASGLSSSSVGTMAGQVVMQGFVNRRIPVFLRRLITMVPALVVVAIGVNPTSALIVSQVVLSFGIPFALVPLVLFTRDRKLMGALVNRRLTTVAAVVVATLIIVLNVVLLALTFGA
ncbi:MAG: Nramp family divalent metal transporter [Gaiellales bacterium]